MCRESKWKRKAKGRGLLLKGLCITCPIWLPKLQTRLDRTQMRTGCPQPFFSSSAKGNRLLLPTIRGRDSLFWGLEMNYHIKQRLIKTDPVKKLKLSKLLTIQVDSTKNLQLAKGMDRKKLLEKNHNLRCCSPSV